MSIPPSKDAQGNQEIAGICLMKILLKQSNDLCMGNYNKTFMVPSGGDLLVVVHFLLRKI